MELVCEVCKKTYSNLSNLKKHIKKLHSSCQDQLLGSKKTYKFQCEKCGKNFNHQHHLRFHMKSHGVPHERNGKETIKCSMLCTYRTNSSQSCIQHYATEHNVHLEHESFEFLSLEAFEKWKNGMEKETKSKYVKERCFTSKLHYTLKYVCHRSGHFVSQSTGKRRLKTKGSNKIDGFCPAGLTVVVKNGKYCVKFCKTHVGHQADLGHLFFTSEERASIADKIAAKIPFDVILDNVRDSVKNEGLERIHLVTKKDLYNIKNSFNRQECTLEELSNVSQAHTEDMIAARRTKILNQFSEMLNEVNSDEDFTVIEKAIAHIPFTLAAKTQTCQNTNDNNKKN